MSFKQTISAVIFSLFSLVFAGETYEFSLKQGLEVLNGHIYERVYYTPDSSTELKESELDWELINIPVVSTDINLKLFKYAFLNLSYSGTSEHSSGRMQDYDWLNVEYTGTSELTNYSIHENTLQDFYNLFFNFGGNIPVTKKLSFLPFFSIGTEHISFTGSNGFRQYGTKISGKYNAFDAVDEDGNPLYTLASYNGEVISYEQNFYYYGLGLTIELTPVDKLISATTVQYFPLNSYISYDTHHKRVIPTQFADTLANKTIFSFTQNCDYKINNNISIGCNVWIYYMPDAKGKTYQRKYDVSPSFSYISDWTSSSNYKGSTERFLYSLGIYFAMSF